jgi:CHASE2 domain-containing sensor protein
MGTLVGAWVTTGAALGLYFTPLGGGLGLERLSYDLPAAMQRTTVPTEVAIVYMDEHSERVLGQPSDGPWDRGLHAELVDLLRVAGARLVVFDAVFDRPGPDPNGDAAFARALKENGHVVLGQNLSVTHDSNSAGRMVTNLITQPSILLSQSFGRSADRAFPLGGAQCDRRGILRMTREHP